MQFFELGMRGSLQNKPPDADRLRPAGFVAPQVEVANKDEVVWPAIIDDAYKPKTPTLCDAPCNKSFVVSSQLKILFGHVGWYCFQVVAGNGSGVIGHISSGMAFLGPVNALGIVWIVSEGGSSGGGVFWCLAAVDGRMGEIMRLQISQVLPVTEPPGVLLLGRGDS